MFNVKSTNISCSANDVMDVGTCNHYNVKGNVLVNCQQQNSEPIAAYLCGGSSWCIALISDEGR